MRRAPMGVAVWHLCPMVWALTGCADGGPGEGNGHPSALVDSGGDGGADSGGPVDVDGDGFVFGEDCDDDDAAVHPDAQELCDGLDNDCDGTVDGADASDASNWYVDADGDGHGAPGVAVRDCEPPDGHVSSRDDCDDGEPTVHPDMEEICNDGLDNDCDGSANDCVLNGDVDLATAQATLLGPDANAIFGHVVAGAGDLDGDGRDDLLVSSKEALSPGFVYLFGGAVSGETLAADATARLGGDADGDDFGIALAPVGDPDGVGFDAFLVGAYDESSLAYHAGAIYSFSGPITGQIGVEDAEAVVLGEAEYQSIGGALSGAGDLSGDGLADVLIGAAADDTIGVNAGAVFVVQGPLSGIQPVSAVAYAIRGERAGDQLGEAVAGVGDTDGDGLGDLVAGASRHETEGEDRGAAYVVLGPVTATMNARDASAKLVGLHDGDHLGLAVAAAGDVDGDGRADLWVGAPGQHEGADHNAGAYLFLGPVSSGTLEDAHASLATAEADNLGDSLAGGQDIDGDGIPDVLAGAAGSGGTGAAYLSFGPFTGSVDLDTSGARVAGPDAGDTVGESVALVGDANGDGLADILVGGPRDDTWLTDAGAAWLILGSGL